MLCRTISAYLSPNDLKPIVEAAEEVGANTMYDGAHVLGLIAGKQSQDPLGDGMNLITASTHKTLPGPQHGVILGNDDVTLPNGKSLHKTIRNKVFPGVHSNHHLHKVAAFGASLAEAIEFQEDYAKDIISNAKALAEGLWNRGMNVFAADQGFTESHTVLVDVSERGGGADVSKRAESQGLIMNKKYASRRYFSSKTIWNKIRNPEMTRLGMGKDAMDEVADLIHLASLGGNESEVRERAKTLKNQYCKIHYCWEYEGKAYPKPKWSNL